MASVPPVVRLLADPVRWQLVSELSRSDRRVRELVAATGLPQNLISYHLRLLRVAGLVTARHSSLDRRDTYYRLELRGCSRALDAAAAEVHPALARHRPAMAGRVQAPAAARRVLFICTGNSSRSPMAEALLRHRAGSRVQAASAGIRPRPVHPHAAAVMRDRYCLDISVHRPTSVAEIAAEPFDYLISLCDKAREACPELPARPRRVHWSLPDPAAGEGGLSGYPAFERAAAELADRIGFLIPALDGP